MNQANKIFISIIVTAVVVGGGEYLFLKNNTANNLESKSQAPIVNEGDDVVKTKEVETLINRTPDEKWFNSHPLSEWFQAGDKSNLAISYIKKIENEANVVPFLESKALSQAGLNKYSESNIPNCPGLLFKSNGSDNTPSPGQMVLFLSLDKDVSDGGVHNIYIATSIEQDELKNSYYKMFGPYNENVKNLVDSFGNLKCVEKVSK